MTFAGIFAGSHSTLTFTERRRDKLYQKYLKDKISIHKITIFHLRIQSQKNICSQLYVPCNYMNVYWAIPYSHIFQGKTIEKPNMFFFGFPQTGEQ